MKNVLYFNIHTPQVIWELIEHDIIVINLKHGYYYDISGLSAMIWLMIENACAYDEILQTLKTYHTSTPETLQADLNFFLCTLEEEALIQRTETPKPPIVKYPITFDHLSDYHRPELKKYTDMQNLLLIDPIHEVDDHGWPNRYPLPTDA